VKRTLLGAVIGLGLVAGCGGEQEFDGREFVDRANQSGAGIVLGEPLVSARDDVEVYELEFTDGSATGGDGDAEHGHEDGGGSMAVAADAGAAKAEYQRCEEAVSLVCYRAANVTLFLEALDPAEQARIDRAIRDLASD